MCVDESCPLILRRSVPRRREGQVMFSNRPRGSDESDRPQACRDDSDEERRVGFAEASQARIFRDGVSGFHSFDDCNRTENAAAAKNADDREDESGVGFLAGNGCFLEHHLPALDEQVFAAGTIFFSDYVDEAIAAEILAATNAAIHGGNVRVILALHGVELT